MGLSALLGALVGAVLGLTGAGGGILAVPALSLGMHWTMQQAAPVALIAVALGAAVGAVEGLRKGLVRYKAALLIALSSLPLVYLGQALAQHMQQSTLQAAFAAVMLLVAWRMHRQAGTGPAARTDAPARIHPVSGKFIWTPSTALLLACIGGGTGLLTGLLGVGGGFVIVPMLRRYTQVSMQGVVATSLAVIALVGSGGVASAMLRHADIAWLPAAVFSATTALGMMTGRWFIHRISPSQVQAAFAILLALVALGMLVSAGMHNLR